MKKLISIVIIFILFSLLAKGNNRIHFCESKITRSKIIITSISQKNKPAHPKPQYYAPFQGKKIFCSDERKEKIVVTIKGNNVNIVTESGKISGVYKNNKVLITNDPNEAEYRRYAAGSHHYGTYYVIEVDYLSVLLGENGEYDSFSLCK